MINCPVCGENVENKKFCPNCGSAIHEKKSAEDNPKYCTGCGEMLDENSQFCSNCGYDMENGVPNVIEREIKAPSKPVKNRKALYIIIGVVAVIIVLTAAFNAFPQGNTKINGVGFNIPEGYITDMQKASLFESGFKSKNSVIFEVESGNDDLVGALIHKELFKNKEYSNDFESIDEVEDKIVEIINNRNIKYTINKI